MQNRDRDSQIGGARLLGSSTRGSLNQRSDRDDLFRFNLSGRSSINLELSGITRRTNADIELYRLNRSLQDVTRSIGKVSFRMLRGSQRSQNLSLVGSSRGGGNSSEQISTNLDAGDYIVRVLQRQGNSRYQVSLRSTVILPPPPPENPVPAPTPGPSPTPAPGSTPTPTPPPTAAIPLAIPTANAIAGNVGSSRPLVDYSFSLADSRDLEFNLSGLTGDADVAILGADRATVLRTSSNLGANPERFIQTLQSGNYFLRVLRKDATVNTNFQLRVTPLTDAVDGDAQASAVPVTFNPTTQIFTQSNYVVGGSSQSPFDYYQFTTPAGQPQFFTAQMTGLFDNLDIELSVPSDPNAPILQSNGAGAGSETFGGTLAGGTTYILKVASGAVAPGAAPAGSTYSLSLRLSSTQSRPSVSRDINFGTGNAGITGLTAAGLRAYFIANDGGGNALWVSDGTLNGTRSIRRFSGIGSFTTVDGILYFAADDGTSGIELWRSDGTAAGTRIVQDYRPGAGSLNPTQFTVVGNRLYFLGQRSNDQGDISLFYFNPGGAITPVISPTSNPNVEVPRVPNLTAIGDTLYFVGSERIGASTSGVELMRIKDADNLTTIDRIDVYENLGPSTPEASSPAFLTAVGNSLFFQARRLVAGTARTELVRFTPGDGATTVDTLTTFDVPPTDTTSNPANLINLAGTLYFTANGENASRQDIGTELWALPNAETALSTQVPLLVNDINPTSSSSPSDLVNLNGALYFLADDGTGRTLWRTQQSSGVFTTAKVSPIVNSRLDGVEITDRSSDLDLIVVGQGVGAYLYFVGTRAGDTELWFTNGTEAGTGVFNINSTDSSRPAQLTNINGRLFLVATTPERGEELWTFQGIPNPS